MDNKPNLSREVKLQWAGSRERLSTPVEAEFFLDIPFYRTHGLGVTPNARFIAPSSMGQFFRGYRSYPLALGLT
jgi:hypothetical protein